MYLVVVVSVRVYLGNYLVTFTVMFAMRRVVVLVRHFSQASVQAAAAGVLL